MSAYEFTPYPRRPPTRNLSLQADRHNHLQGRLKLTANGLLEPGEPGRRVLVPEHIAVKDLAGLLELKPFRVVAEIMDFGQFKHADDVIDFSLCRDDREKAWILAEKTVWGCTRICSPALFRGRSLAD